MKINFDELNNQFGLKNALEKICNDFGDVAFSKFIEWFTTYRGNDVNDFTGKQILDEQWELFLEEVFSNYEVPIK